MIIFSLQFHDYLLQLFIWSYFMKKEKIELKERNNKDTIKTVPLPKLVKILDEWVKNHPKDMEILGR